MRSHSGRFAPNPIALVAALAFLLAAGPRSAAAESAPAPGAPVELVRLTIRPGHESEIERFLARLAEAARRTGAPVRWSAHRRIEGDRPVYLLVLRGGSEAELDDWGELTASEALERAYGAEEARRLLALREVALEGVQRERFVAAPALDLGR